MNICDNEPLRLVLISRRFPPQIGGAEQVMANMAEALAKLGHLVTVLSSENETEGVSRSIDTDPADKHHNPKLIRLPYSGLRFVGTLGYMFGLWRWLRSNPPDLAYVSMLKHDAYVAVRAGRSFGFPVVLRPEGTGETGDMAWQQKGRFGKTIGRMTHQADSIVCLSKRVQDELLNAAYRPDQLHLIPNGVPVPKQCWKPPQLGQDRFVIYVGRLSPEKGLENLLNAWPGVISKCPDASLKLVGDGLLLTQLKHQADVLNVSASVKFFGASNNVQSLLSASSVFVLPSLEEGLSMALLEAMALGIPVVVTDIPGNRTLVKHGETGRLIKINQPVELADAICEALACDRETLRMTIAGRNLVRNHFSIESIALEHDKLFRECLAARHPK